MNRAHRVFGGVLLLLSAATVGCAQTQPSPPPQPVPVMDGGAGPCALELTVTSEAKPVYAAIVRVHVSFGFGGFHKLDLQAETNSDGRVKFTGLPAKVHHPPLEFLASKADATGMATFDPQQACQAKHELVLAAPKPPPDK
jgi:hypothetical protein